MDVAKFKNIFTGLDRARGLFTFEEEDVSNGKSVGLYRTIKEEPLLKHYQSHFFSNEIW